MDALQKLLMSLATIGLAAAGLMWILGLHAIRDRLLRYAVAMMVLSVLLAMLTRAACNAVNAAHRVSVPTTPISAGMSVAIVLGHLVLGVVVLRRRLRGPEDGHRRIADIERARTRERTRVAQSPEEPES